MALILRRPIQRPAVPGGGSTGAPAAGVPLAGVGSGDWLASFSSDERSLRTNGNIPIEYATGKKM
jgi:hypothetical protein